MVAKKVAKNLAPPGKKTAKEESKQEKLQAEIDRINRTKGLSDFAKVRKGSQIPPIERIRTGILTLDVVMGGGIPRARFTQFKGAESCFKTSAIFHAIREVQADGGTAAYVQGEEFDRAWASKIGVDLERLHVVTVADNGGRSLEQLCELIETGLVDLAVVDSVQGLTTERELDETGMGESGYGSGGPQMWGQWTRRVTRAFNRGAGTAVLWTSQMRSQPGKYTRNGDSSDGTQIWALKHAKSVDVQFKRGEAFRNKDDDGGPYARDFSVKADKNKTSHPNVSGAFRFYYRSHDGVSWGVDTAREAAILGQTLGDAIQRRGAWYSVDGTKVAQGVDNLVTFLRNEPDVLASVVERVYEALAEGGSMTEAEPELEDEEEAEEEEES